MSVGGLSACDADVVAGHEWFLDVDFYRDSVLRELDYGAAKGFRGIFERLVSEAFLVFHVRNLDDEGIVVLRHLKPAMNYGNRFFL